MVVCFTLYVISNPSISTNILKFVITCVLFMIFLIPTHKYSRGVLVMDMGGTMHRQGALCLKARDILQDIG